MKSFNSSAAYYAVLSDTDERLQREGPFLKQWLERAPGRRVGDLASGTGMHAAFFAGLDAEVTALDISPEMVAFAQAHSPHPNITYNVADMRLLDGGPWDLAVCLGNSLSLVHSVKEVEKTLQSVYRCLSPGGFFIVQTLNYDGLDTQKPRHRIVRKRVRDTEVVAVKSLVPYDSHTLLTLTFFAMEKEHYDSVAEGAILLNLTRESIGAAAEKTGFQTVEVFGNYDGTPYQSDTSPDLIAVFQRPGL